MNNLLKKISFLLMSILYMNLCGLSAQAIEVKEIQVLKEPKIDSTGRIADLAKAEFTTTILIVYDGKIQDASMIELDLAEYSLAERREINTTKKIIELDPVKKITSKDGYHCTIGEGGLKINFAEVKGLNPYNVTAVFVKKNGEKTKPFIRKLN